MKNVLLATAAVLAAAAVPAVPAQAESSGGGTLVGVPSSHGGSGIRVHRGFDGDRDRRDRRRFDDDVAVSTWIDGGQWALYNNRSWEPDSYNDWWHDRPDRAFPRWVQAGDCQRMWWSGGGWRC